jgi:hypothetical protein
MKYITQKQLSEKLEPINLQALIAQETTVVTTMVLNFTAVN